jgi:hypothetical protein
MNTLTLLATFTAVAMLYMSGDSVPDLMRKINDFVEHYYQHPKPFMWNATADSTLAKLKRLVQVICGTSLPRTGAHVSAKGHRANLMIDVGARIRCRNRLKALPSAAAYSL